MYMYMYSMHSSSIAESASIRRDGGYRYRACSGAVAMGVTRMATCRKSSVRTKLHERALGYWWWLMWLLDPQHPPSSHLKPEVVGTRFHELWQGFLGDGRQP